jgi:hypothetical protein
MELPSRERAALGLINTSGTPLNCGGRESGGAVGLLDQTGEVGEGYDAIQCKTMQ